MNTKRIRSIICFVCVAILSLCAAAFLTACGDGNDESQLPVFKLDKSETELTVDGNVEQLTLTVANVDETPQWTSSKPDVATVTVGNTPNKATVRAVSAGVSVIKVTAGDNIAVCTVKVNPAPKLELMTESLNILVGRTASIVLDTDIDTLTYTSDKPKIATVNQNGLVTGKAGGTAKITVSGGGKSVVCNVTVFEASVELDRESVQLLLVDGHNTVKLNAVSNGKVEWGSNDENVAIVDDTGLVTAVGLGETEVYAIYESARATCVIKVKNELLTVTLDKTELTIEDGETSEALVAKVVGTNGDKEGSDAAVVWSVEKGDDIVSVSDGVVTSLGGVYGTAIVRATSALDADAYAECSVTVPDPRADWVQISDKASFLAAFASDNAAKHLYLTNDVDVEGETLSSGINEFTGTFEGNGYTIRNYSGNLFHNLTGSITNVSLVCDTSALSAHMGVIGHHPNSGSIVKDVLIEVTYSKASTHALFFHGASNATIDNVVVIAHNGGNFADTTAGVNQLNGATLTNVYYMNAEGSVGAGNATAKTEAQLKTSATFDGTWDEGWIIKEGQLPVLRNADNEETVEINFANATIEIGVGEVTTISADVLGTRLSPEWTVSGVAATISGDGKDCEITPVAAGTVTITARIGDVSASITVNVHDVYTVSINKDTDTVLRGSSETYTATVLKNGQPCDKVVTWTVDDDTVATITPNDNECLVAAIKVGEAILKASAEGVDAICVITVEKPQTIMNIDVDSVELKMGETETAEVSVTVTNNDETPAWTTGSADIATVSPASGTTVTVTAVAAGRTTLTVTADDVTITIEIVISPADGTDPTDVTLELSETDKILLTVGDTHDISVIVKGSAEIPAWSCVGEAVTVSPENGTAVTITAVKAGLATVVVSVGVDGTAVTAEIEIDVADQPDIELDKTEVIVVNSSEHANYTAQVTATVKGRVPLVTWAITEGEDNIILSGTDTNTVTVTAKAVGTATVTATIGDVVKTFTVTVNSPVAISVDKATLEIEYGATDTLTVTVEGTTDDYAFEAEGNSVSVTKSGDTLTLRAVGVGETTITVSVGGKSAQCVVTVEAPSVAVIPVENLSEYTYNDQYIRVIAECGNDIAGAVKKNNVTATGTMDGAPMNYNVVDNTRDGTKYWFTVHVPQGFAHEYVINFTFKDAGDVAIAQGTFTHLPPKELKIDKTRLTLEVGGDTGTVTATVNSVVTGEIVWTVDDESIATIVVSADKMSVTVTAVAEGTATITATVDGLSQTCEVTVIEEGGEPPVVVIPDISDKLFQQEVYGSWNIGIRIEAGTDILNQVPANKNYIEIDAIMDGEPVNVTIHELYGASPKYVKFGVPKDWTHSYEFTLKLKNENGEIIAQGMFIKAPEKSLALDKSTLALEIGTTESGTVTATTNAAVTGEISWTISDEAVATIEVSSDKMSVTVTAVGKGSATITATVDGLTKTCKVTVTQEGDAPVEPDVPDISDKLFQQEVYGVYYIGIRFECGSEAVCNSIAEVEVTATKNGETYNARLHNKYTGGPNYYVQIQVYEDWAGNTYEFTITYKNGDGEIIGRGTFVKAS